jgi:hypothetical protein
VYRRFLGEPVKGYEAVIAKPLENRHILDHTPDYYERLKHSYDEAFYKQEVLGEYLNVNQGRVYRGFTREKNLLAVEPDPLVPLRWALDFNVDPMSSVVAQISKQEVCVLDEIVLSRATTQQACQEFLNRFPAHPAGLVVYGDASGDNMKSTGSTDFQIIRESLRNSSYGYVNLSVPKANPSVHERVSLVNAKLCSASGHATLWVHPKCKELIKDFEEVCYKPGSKVIDKEADSKRTHLSDALGYLIFREFPAGAPVGERNKRLI